MSEEKLPSLFSRHWAESALAIGAVLIAAVSLWVGYDTMRTNRELVAAASWPIIQMGESDLTPSGKPQLVLIATNAGIGPAKVESVELLWHGTAYRSSQLLLKACCARAQNAKTGTVHYTIGTLDRRVLRPGQTVDLVKMPLPAHNQAVWEKLHSILYSDKPANRLRFRICYCSAFNACWVTNGHRLNPPRVNACPIPKVPFQG